jgi:hypothetical protein
VEELEQRMAGVGSYAEAQAWQVEEGEDAESFDIDDEQEFNPVLPWEVGR